MDIDDQSPDASERELSPHKKLAIFVPSLRGGGAQRAMVRVAGGFAEAGYAVDLVLAERVGPYLNDVSPNVRIVDLGASRTLGAVFPLAKYLRNERPDGMISAQEYGNIVAIWSRRLSGVKTRLIVSEQNHPKRERRASWRLKTRTINWFLRGFYGWADGVAAVSDGVANTLAEVTRLPRHRIQTIHNPMAGPDLLAKAEARPDHPWFQTGEPPVILGVGSLTPQKDFSLLIKAFDKVRKERAARLMILGEGPLRSELQQLIDERQLKNDAVLQGFVDNPYSFMRHAELFVLSSQFEGLPSVLIEAMACGTRVVATDCPSGPMEILKGGEYGPLVPMGDEDSLAAAIESALAGEVPPPPDASCHNYQIQTVVKRYTEALFGTAEST